MSSTTYSIIHVIALLVLNGGTFFAFAAQPETRKKTLMLTGIASLLMVISGVGLMHKLGYAWTGWVFVKLVCWLGLSALGGIAYRKRGLVPVLKGVALGLVTLAVIMVYTKPF